MKSVLLLVAVLVFSQATSAQGFMAESKSACLNLENDGRDFRDFQTDYHRFLNEFSTLSAQMQFDVMLAGVGKSLRLLSKINSDSGLRPDMKEMALILDYNLAVQENDRAAMTIVNLNRSASFQHLFDGLQVFEKAIQSKLELVQGLRRDCSILVAPK